MISVVTKKIEDKKKYKAEDWQINLEENIPK